MGTLRLEIVDFRDADHWRFLLTDEAGSFLADHVVDLDRTDDEYEGFAGLHSFLRWYADPDRPRESEAELIDRVGRWIGQRVLGGAIGRTLVDHSPVVVRVAVPAEAAVLFDRPLELAYVEGIPLALQDVSLVFEPAGEYSRPKAPVEGRLRLLAVFSLPTSTAALAVRRERAQLTRLVERMAARQQMAIELRVVQYGVTRQRLLDILEEAAGWDVVHFSGHGLAGGIVLERPDGTPDLVSTSELGRLLGPARRRLKLVTLMTEGSAASTAAAVLRSLGLDVPGEEEAVAVGAAGMPAQSTRPPETPLPTLAAELARRLSCAVLALRYPVTDDFTTELTARLYEGLLHRRLELPRALQLALAAVAGEPSLGIPALPAVSPALFGTLAATLSLPVPEERPHFNVARTAMAYFPGEPERFVGRAALMARASAALAPESPHTGVLLHGMAGSGKTTCALELAYRHEQAFRTAAWWKAPEGGQDITGSLLSLAVALETQLPGLSMVTTVDNAQTLADFLPRFTELLERNVVLLVLDNLDWLLTAAGMWRDPRWEFLTNALVTHEGESRVILTSRIVPRSLPPTVLVEAVHTLSLDEAVLLARDLPNLRRLLGGDAHSLESEAQGRGLLRRTLAITQGHPKLLELADALARDPRALPARLDEAEQTMGRPPEGQDPFLVHGETNLSSDQFLGVLERWTRGAQRTLPDASRTLFSLLCVLEEEDRRQEVVESIWVQVWRQSDREAELPPIPTALSWLAAQGLVEPQPSDNSVRYAVNAWVAEAGRREAGRDFEATVAAMLFALLQVTSSSTTERQPALRPRLTFDRSAVRYLLRTVDLVGDAVAEPLLRQALETQWAALGARTPEVAALDDLADVHRVLGNDTLAEPLLRLALERRLQAWGQDHPQVATGLDRLARVLRALGDHAAAEPLLRRSVDIRRVSLGETHPLLADSLRTLAVLLVAMERAPEAMPLIAEAVAIEDRILRLALPLGANARTAHYVPDPETSQDILVSLVHGHLRDSPTAIRKALDVVLRRKLLGVELELPGIVALEGRDPKAHRLVKLFEDMVVASWEEPEPHNYQGYQDRLALLGAERQRLETELAVDLPELLLAQHVWSADRAAVARVLPEGSVLVEFVRLPIYDFNASPAAGRSRWKPARYLAFVMPAGEPENVQVVDLGPAEAIEQLVAAFGMMVRNQGSEWNPQLAAALHSAIFDPLRQTVGARRYLVVAPDGELHQVPFAVLQDGDRQLIDGCHVSYLQTGRDALRSDLERHDLARHHSPSPPLVLGGPSAEQEVNLDKLPPGLQDQVRAWLRGPSSSLSGVGPEVKRIASKLGVKPWRGTRGLRKRVQAYRSPRLLHIGVPGYRVPIPPRVHSMDPLDPVPSMEVSESQADHPSGRDLLASAGLVLAGDDGLLTAGDLAVLDLSGTTLTVLSSLQIGSGPVGSSTALLQRALLTAGCAHLMMNLWPLSDQSMVELMEVFYNRILSNTPPGEALREAQLAVRASNPSPLGWGAFICLGDVSPLSVKSTHFVKAHNPYQVGLPLKGAKTFVGRQDVLSLLVENLNPSAGNNVLVLRGQRRTGKTSVLYRMQLILPGETQGAYMPVLVDMQGMSDVASQSEFYFRMANKIWEDLNEQGIEELPEPLLADYSSAAGSVFEFNFLRRVTDALGERRLLLMVDEFDEVKELIDRGVLPAAVLRFWRHLMQHRPVLFLIAGTQKLRELTGGYWSVFFNLQVPIDIGTLPEGAARWLITKPVEDWYDIQSDAVDEVIRAAGCHPYFTQLVCYKLVEVRNEFRLSTVTVADVAEAISRALESGDDQIGYPWTERDCTAAERLVLAVMASEGEGQTPVAIDTIRRRLAEASLAVDIATTLKRLTERGVVRRDDNYQLTFVVPLFHAWIMRERYDSLKRTVQYNQDQLAAESADPGR